MAVVFPVLSLPAAFVIWIGWLSLPTLRDDARRLAAVALGLAGLAAVVGVVRFVVEYAVAGIVSGGQTATSRRAVSRLRELVFAQDMMRKNGVVDPDGDGIGSAGLIGELAGSIPLRTGYSPKVPILNREWRRSVQTPLGPAVEAGGYLFIVCLPTAAGWTARPGVAVEDEGAERRFVAYAWPSVARPGFSALYFVDEHERILVGRALEGQSLPFIGSSRPPPCDAAEVSPPLIVWGVWENKPPRSRLPGGER